MMLANYHTHTVRCKHAVGSEREYIEAAIANGFKILGFSDHTPWPYPEGVTSGIRMGMDEIPDYTETLVKLREEYKDRIQILIGYEVEYFPKYFDSTMFPTRWMASMWVPRLTAKRGLKHTLTLPLKA